jgi:YHS domain-containing protein
MVRLVLFLILFIFIARTFWRIIDNVIEAASGRAPGERGAQPPLQSAKMVRDPVCGTFVLPERSVSSVDARGRSYFCSETCRDRYRAESVKGRTA